VLPILIFALVALPLLVIAFVVARRRDTAGEHPATETDADRLEMEREFEESERYQAQWRDEQHKHPHDD
jgi:hypothetical protein